MINLEFFPFVIVVIGPRCLHQSVNSAGSREFPKKLKFIFVVNFLNPFGSLIMC